MSGYEDPHRMGRSKADAYFMRQESEKIKKLAEENAARREQERLDELRELHWMCCPKDGMPLEEITHMGIRVDKCARCGGIFLDAGELEAIFDANLHQDGVIGRILNAFRSPISIDN